MNPFLSGPAEDVIRHGLADPHELRRRLVDLPLSAERLEEVCRMVEGAIARAERGPPF